MGKSNERPVTRVQVSTRLDININNQLDKLSLVTGIPKTKLLDEAIEGLLTKEWYMQALQRADKK